MTVISALCWWIEFGTRILFVNFPTYVLAKAPELDRICSIVHIYLLFQLVGFCWAFLVNASFAIACQTSAFMPFTQGSNTLQVMASFYVCYASIRVVIAFAQNTSHMAMQSIQDFPTVAEDVCRVGKSFLSKMRYILIPLLALQAAILSADTVCTSQHFILQSLCTHTGLHFLSSIYPDARHLVLCSLMILVLQVWQVLMHQFPRWDQCFKRAPKMRRLCLQLSVVGLGFITIVQLLLLLTLPLHVHHHTELISTSSLCITLFCWSLWIYYFLPVIVDVYGDTWTQSTNARSILELISSIRIYNMFLYFLFFLGFNYRYGYLQSQLNLTVLGILVPFLSSVLYIAIQCSLRVSLRLWYVGGPIAIASAYVCTSLMTPLIGGQGSIVLVSLHIFTKLVQYFGEDVGYSKDDDWHPEETPRQRKRKNSSAEDEEITSPRPSYWKNILQHTPSINSERSTPRSNQDKSEDSPPMKQLFPTLRSRRRRSHSFSITSLASRGTEDSSLVSLGHVSQAWRKHWIVEMSQRTIAFFMKITKHLAITDSLLSAIVRAGTTLAVVISLILGIVSVASVLQQNTQMFPKLIDVIRTPDVVHFDHIISNVTLHRHRNQAPASPRVAPRYAGCDLMWKELGILDMAILSELSYVDDTNSSAIQEILNDMFPHMEFEYQLTSSIHNVNSSHFSGGPMFLEAYSAKHNTTVIAVRGTDIGRLHDFLEDVKLFAEPVIFSLLSTVFPVMRLWSDYTTSAIIQLIHESNKFFGLKGEAEYYQPLVQRVKDIARSSEQRVILTGHSLGGGLARIVGALTNISSVSFSPPGIALSHKKYSVLNVDGSTTYLKDVELLYDRSLAVLTSHDWYCCAVLL